MALFLEHIQASRELKMFPNSLSLYILIAEPNFPPSVFTHLADSSLQQGIQSPLRCVHVSRYALAFDHTRELAYISSHTQDVVEAMGWTTADLIITVETLEKVLVATFRNV